MAQNNNRLKYYISFEADTKKAKAQIDEMFKSLQQVNAPKNVTAELFNKEDFSAARKNIAELETMLRNAVNVDTGRLDLSKLNRSLSQSNKTLSNFASSFSTVGEEGRIAFSKITEAVLKGEMPLRRQNRLLDKMKETMSNTIRWQVSATALNAFTTAISDAYQYAEDLNRSLNDIRIVSGQSVEQMDAFAERANKAARELRTTTKAYTDAALIFYQQGLEDDEVMERTNAVMKMSNVTGEAATDVSSYMTAIWNNFDNGAHTLEYYADAITKLGAETAASSEEIAGGLEKFAAVADTVGLSYEYATAALATVIDKTRQSEEIVGTAFKTIFARLSSLSLGETLEDGTNLTKYSQALANVGITITQQNGELKEMDVILDELGAKWQGLNGAQKNALAQTVAGVRQYNQLVALLDNYDDFKINVDLALEAEGTLTEQSKIFEESWLGAKKRVTAALEGIYDTLLNDKIFIFFTNGLASIIEGIDWVIDRAGGLPAAISLAGLAIQKMFGTSIKQTIDDLFYGIRTSLGHTQRDIASLIENVARQNEYVQAEYETGENQSGLYAEQAKWTAQILRNHQRITDEMLIQYKAQQEKDEAYRQAAIFLEQSVEARKSQNFDLNGKIPKTKAFKAETSDLDNWSFATELAGMANKEFRDILEEAIEGMDNSEIKNKLRQKISGFGDLRFGQQKKDLEKFATGLDDLRDPSGGYLNNRELKASYLAVKYKKGHKDADQKSIKQYLDNIQKIKTETAGLEEARKRLSRAELDMEAALESNDEKRFYAAEKEFDKEIEIIKAKENSIKETTEINKQNIAVAQEFNGVIHNEFEERERINKLNLKQKEDLEQMLGVFTSMAFKGISAISAMTAGMKALGDETLTVEQRFTSAVTSFSMGTMQFMAAMNDFSKLKKSIKSFEVAEGTFLYSISGGAKDLLGVVKALAPKILIAAAALGALYGIFKLIESTTPEYKLEKAKEAAEKASKAATEATKAYSELKTTLDGFNEKYNAIEDMVVGTIEWRNAVSELNDQLLEVIEKYDLIEKTDFYYDEQGILRLTSSGQTKAQDQARRNMAITSSAARNANADVDRLNAAIAKSNAEGHFNLYSNDSDESYNSIEAQKAINNIVKDAIEKNAIPSLEELKKTFSELGIVASDKELNSFIDKVKEAANAAGQAKTSNIAAYGSMVSGYVGKNSINVDPELMPEYNEAQTNFLSDWVENKEQEYKNSGDWKTLTNTSELEKILGVDLSLNAFGTGYKYTDAQGNKQKLSKEEASRYLASKDLEDEYENLLSFNNTNALNYAKEVGYGKLYEKEELDNRDNEKRAQRTASNAIKSDLDEDQVLEYQQYLKEVYKITEEMSKDMAVANMRFNAGMEDLIDNWDDYKQKLDASNKGTAEYVLTLESLKQTMSEILNVDTKYITEDFLTNAENMALMEQAYLGNVEAIGELQKNMMSSLLDGIDTIDEKTLGRFNDVIEQMNLNSEDLKIGMTLEDEAVQRVYGDFVKLMDEMLQAGIMTADQVNEALAGINLTPEIEYEKVTGVSRQEAISTGYILGQDGKYQKITSSTEFDTTTEIYVPKINAANTTVSGIPSSKLNSANRNKAAGNASSRQDKMKKADDEIERYHLIKEVIEDVNTELDRLGKQKDRAWGQSHIDLIDQEIEKTQEAIDAQKEYLEQIKGWREFDQAAIAGFGATFDEMGRITNYEQLMREQIAAYNAAVASGNETRIEAAEERYEKFTKALSKYEETADLFESEYEKLLDLQNQYYDKLLEKVQYKVEINVQISEEADRYYDYILDRLEDKAYSAAEAIAVLGSKTDESLERIKAYQEGLNSIFENHGFGEDALQDFLNGKISAKQLAESGFTTEEIETIIQYRNALLEENANLLELRDNIMNQVLETFNEYLDTIDNLIDKFEHLSNVTKSYKNIVDIVGKKALGISNDLIRTMNDVVVENAANSVGAAKDKLESTEKALAELSDTYAEYNEKANDTSLSEAERKYWAEMAEQVKKDMEEVEQSSQEAKEAFLSSWENALTTAREIFEENIDLIVEEFEDMLSGIYGSLDAMKEAYDQNKTLREQYLEEYERIYELNKLNRDITNSLDTTDSILAKQTLRDLQEEINELQRSGAQISEYDLSVLRARYELRLAEIAMEDAQNAKSQVRMSRDNDGNWSYVYTADRGKVSESRQNYENKLFELQQKNNDYLNQMQEKWITTEQEMIQAYVKIMTDKNLSEEEQLAAIDRLYDYYGQRFQFFNDQITNALGNNKLLYEEDWKSWAEKNDTQIESNDSFQTSFDDTILGITTGVHSIEELHQQLNAALGAPGQGGFLGDLDDAYWAWQKDVDQIMNMAGTSVENFGEDFEKVAKDTQEASDKTAEEVDNMADAMDKSFADASKAARDWANEYATAISEAVLRNETMRGSLGKLLEAISAVTGAYIDLSSVAGLGSNATFKDLLAKMQAARNGILDDDDTEEESVKKYKIVTEKNKKQVVGDSNLTWEEAEKLWKSKYGGHGGSWSIVEMATGGYTGEWGSNGKLAMLHEKELVLNKEDTENMLKAVEVVRDIMAVTDSQASMSRMGIGAMTARTYAPFDGGMMEQSVTIYADFPNATNHSEIEEAFKDMMNLASQYANRKV